MSAADERLPVTDAEAAALFADLVTCKALVLAVSGGPDSTALLLLIARWRAKLRDGPSLLAVTIDHGLRPEARREAAAVKRLAAALGVAHRTLRWTGPKPETRLQEAARAARYRLLAAAAARAKAHVLTAHTLDDQAETVLFRLTRGSGLAGLAAMARVSPLPVFPLSSPGLTRRSNSPSRVAALRFLPRLPGRVGEGADDEGALLVRPFLEIPKARLMATLQAAKIPFAEDPSNRDPRFARARFRAFMPALADEGLTPARLAQLAARLRRANEAIEAAVDQLAEALAAPALAPLRRGTDAPISLAAADWAKAPAEIRLRLLGSLVAITGDEGDIELAKLEACEQAVAAHLHARSSERFRRTLAGAVITLAGDRLTVGRAPPRRKARSARRENMPRPEA
ncbi:MAG: tRNA lysidine(34) synthetase TilS [Rhodoplanes sp.]